MSALLVERKLAISTMVCDQGPKSVEIFRELKKTHKQTHRHEHKIEQVLGRKTRKKKRDPYCRKKIINELRNQGYNN